MQDESISRIDLDGPMDLSSDEELNSDSEDKESPVVVAARLPKPRRDFLLGEDLKQLRLQRRAAGPKPNPNTVAMDGGIDHNLLDEIILREANARKSSALHHTNITSAPDMPIMDSRVIDLLSSSIINWVFTTTAFATAFLKLIVII